jgi:hypothetical protein
VDDAKPAIAACIALGIFMVRILLPEERQGDFIADE